MARPTVALFASPDGVGARLAESFISNLYTVKILSGKEVLWQKLLRHIQQKNLFQVVNPEKEKEFANFEYLVLVDLDLNFSPAEILSVTRLAVAQSARILVILPFVAESVEAWQKREKVRGLILKKTPEAGIIYSGELFGPRYYGRDKNYITRNITSALVKGSVESLEDASLYPTSIEAFSKFITRSVFSFGPYGREIAVYSQEIDPQEFLSILTRSVGGVAIEPPKFGGERQEVFGINQILAKSDFGKSLEETLLWVKQNLVREPSVQKRKNNFYFVKRGITAGTIVLLLLPFILALAGSLGVLFSFNSVKKGRALSAKKSLSFAKFTAQNSQKFFYVYSQIPLVSKLYAPFVSPANVLFLSTEIGLNGVEIVQKARELATLSLGENIFDPSQLSQELAVELGALYQKTSFLGSEIKNLNGFSSRVVSRFVNESTLENIRQKILSAEALSENLPEILGKGTPKTYLVLFQNNMELRPTGGFIGSFALVSFDSGRLVDITVSDVYAADGQLKGHVEPPAPIRKYLGEANWFLRDSNWDPDFPTSAARAEWFLDKEIDMGVDGVVGVDLEVARGLLEATGPVILSDFNQVFDYKNLYERLQYEVESDFFPGSQKKTSVLTALTREIMNRLSSLPEDKYIPVARQVAQALEEKHIQIYLNDASLEKTISQMGYSGELSVPVCKEECFADWYAAVDANLGVTKANYFIEREFKFDATLSEQSAKKTLEITYKNTANSALGTAGRYRTYTRVFVPSGSIFGKVQIENAGVIVETDAETEILGDKMSGGVNVEISPGQTKKLIFTWETPVPQNLSNGEYEFYIRKQAGTSADPLTVNVLTPQEVKSYNTTLVKDFILSKESLWTQKP